MTRAGNELWYYDLNYQWIGRTNTNGNLGFSFLPGDNTIRDLAYDGTYIWVVTTTGIVKQFTESGDLVGTIPGLLTGGWGLTFDGTYLWASNPATDKLAQISLQQTVEGDVDNNGRVDRDDVLAVLNHILNILILEGNAFQQADCNRDEQIDIFDALGIVNVILTLGSCASWANMPEHVPEIMEYVHSLESNFSAEDFSRCMDLIKTELEVPTEYLLFQNYPNPFNGTTSIQYSVISEQSLPHVTLKIYNLLGQEVRTLVDEVKEAGYYSVTWDGKDDVSNDVASGIYFYRMTVDGSSRDNRGNSVTTKRMIMMK